MTFPVLATFVLGLACGGSDGALAPADAAPPAASPAESASDPVPLEPPAPGDAIRVAGDRTSTPEPLAEGWRLGAMVVEAPLPVGYPAPTPPGAMELKSYPSVRRAEYQGAGDSERGRNGGFWPLFQHISEREIAMTSPVEMDYPGWSGEQGESGPWVMSFLYRTADLGPTGDDGNVRVVDTEPVTVLAVGIRGPYTMTAVSTALRQIEAWLDANPQWEAAGDPRAFYYNGPSIPDRRKWSEAQMPVRRAADRSAP